MTRPRVETPETVTIWVRAADAFIMAARGAKFMSREVYAAAAAAAKVPIIQPAKA